MVLLNLNSRGFSNPHDFEIINDFNVPLEFSPNSEKTLIGCNLWYS